MKYSVTVTLPITSVKLISHKMLCMQHMTGNDSSSSSRKVYAIKA